MHVFGLLLCLFLNWGPHKTTTNFVFLIFLPLDSTVEMMWQHPPPTSMSCTPSPQNIFHRLGWLSVGCGVSPSTGSNWKSRPRRSLYFYFFIALFDPPKWRANVLPHMFRLVSLPLQHPIHHQHHRLVGCCVPSSNGSHPRYFDGCHWGTPINLFCHSEPKLGHLAPE